MATHNSPLRLEVNPWAHDADLHEALLLRGAYLAALGAMETVFAEVAIRASKHSAYRDVRDRFPSRRDARSRFLRMILAMQGPMQPHAKLLNGALDRFEAALTLRDVLAHAHMRILSGPAATATEMVFRDFYPQGEMVAYREERHSFPWLRTRTHAAARTSRALGRIYGRLDEFLPPLVGEYQGTTDLTCHDDRA